MTANKRNMRMMDGNTAAAHVSYAFSEVAAIFPITPSSPMAELADEWAAKGKKNLFGRPTRVVEMQSEGGAAGAVHGSLQGGALTVTYTSAQGLLLMIPNMYRIAGELLPAVFHVSARALANNSWSVFGDHQDVMATRQTGFAILASSAVQDVMNLAAVAHLTAIKSRVPFLHFFDGFRTSHEVQKIQVLEYDELEKLLDRDAVRAFRDRALSPDHPVHRGMTQNPDVFFQMREAVNPWYLALPNALDTCLAQVNELTGQDYKFFNYYGAPDAEHVVVAMGSACSAIEETVDWLNARGEKTGLLNVRVFRPFCPDRLVAALPKTVKKIAVLDRTKEPGAAGEPLYMDVRGAFYGLTRPTPLIVGGRYGLGAKNFGPSEILAVYENLALNEPKNGFTTGIEDDVTLTSLPRPATAESPAPAGVTACKFWGLGSDGTVGANKSAVKIIGDHTDLYAQAYFAYDSKKSGGVTISHLRFGKTPIKSSYTIDKADFIACHNPAYVGKYDMLGDLKPGGRFLLNTQWTPEEIEKNLPGDMKRAIARKGAEFYIINAVRVAQELGLGSRVNMITQAAFFKLVNIIPVADAAKYLKDAVVESYGRQGQAVIDMNFAAIDRGISDIVPIPVPAAWKDAERSKDAADTGKQATKPRFITDFVEPVNRQEGDSLPVSVFKGREDGTFPLGTSAFEKRGIAVDAPVWRPDRCVQCNQCSFVCPHAVIRPLLVEEKELSGAPAGLLTTPARGFSDKAFHLAISPLDCAGCGNCVDVCPAREKALEMLPLASQLPQAAEIWDFAAKNISYKTLPEEQFHTVKGSQFAQPLLEFSGACSGCGETPYVKLLTQLFGDRLYIQCPSGCTVVWGGSCPSIPYTVNAEGRGPAFAYSLFEDCGEYGFGIHIGATQVRELTADKAARALEIPGLPSALREALGEWREKRHASPGTRERAARLTGALELHKGGDPLLNEIYQRRDFFARKAQWIVGGDGWAYDIGYGGLDHVAASGEDVNILVVDTEVYSNTGGQSSKATPAAAVAGFSASGKRTRKKDLGLMMIPYGSVYVAQVAMGADRNQTLKAFLEAEAYPGVSIVIAYCPCINHGLSAGMGKSQEQARRAVEAGYWGLYRYDPRLGDQGKNPFILDSKPPKASFRDFLMSEVRYAALFRQFPDLAGELFDKCERDAMDRLSAYQRLASQRLASQPERISIEAR
ncbi:MAG: pyruvate:ferredoxin (flavodoxin) oxidoreductase [Synergistaceae bacterium]|jgi:pyruvate-ferredoxin/flavodoxin oxidoreductase|nr:pyruvate:ferredoxin (flavodoxin) oxidoreductase [Synergistaceae bacterium]